MTIESAISGCSQKMRQYALRVAVALSSSAFPAAPFPLASSSPSGRYTARTRSENTESARRNAATWSRVRSSESLSASNPLCTLELFLR